MRLNSLTVCGFRGFREKLKVDFASGFTIISGRNGVGKSTICDAVEYAITGRIEKYKVEKSGGESLEDYFWWRGEGKPEAHYVALEFTGEDGGIFYLKRDRIKGLNVSLDEIEYKLCRSKSKPSKALYELCRTTIIRDELIAAYSLDLNETDRFDLVRSALGAVDEIGYSSRAKEVLSVSEMAYKEAEKTYENARSRLNNALTDLTKIRDSALKSADVGEALKAIKLHIPEVPDDIKEAASAAKDILNHGKVVLNGIRELLGETKKIYDLKKTLDSRKALMPEIRSDIENLKNDKDLIDKELLYAQEKLKAERQSDEMAAALSSLIRHGEHIGLDSGHCPLCRAERSNDEFLVGLEAARARLSELGGRVESAQAVETGLRKRLSEVSEKLSKLESEERDLKELERKIYTFELSFLQIAKQYGVGKDITQVIDDPVKLEQIMLRERSKLIDLERNLLTLESTHALDKIKELEDHIDDIRNEVDKAAVQMAKCQKAVEISKNIDHAVKRTTHEIVDERLALINPLLSELYKRLRPHSNWRDIEYHIRGDVRRFLSLVVGKDLNPQFVFSSGQRRAAGIAFLLSVHLSRLWCKWKTIILDDPVQHIDDFRALHLVEVLAALRKSGHQIICAVEDDALANLLCRRLRSSDENNQGYRYDLEFEGSGNINIKSKALSSFPDALLSSASYV